MYKLPIRIIVLVSVLLSTIAAIFIPGLAVANVIVIMVLVLFAPIWCDR